MEKSLIKLLAVLGLTSAANAAGVSIKEGECWSYAARPGEEASFIVIRKIEMLPNQGEVVHISVFGLKIKNANAPKGYSDEAGHLPIAGSSLRASLKTRIQKQIPKLDWLEGYQLWREAYDAGKGGIFTKSVGECVGFMEESINRGQKDKR